MSSVTILGPVVYRHVDQPHRLGSLACPVCQTQRVAFHSFRHRIVEHLDAEQFLCLVLKVPKYTCANPTCPRKYFTPPVAEAAPHAHTSRLLQRTSSQLYRRGKLALQDVEEQLRTVLHAGTGKSSVLRWHHASLDHDYPHPASLPFSSVLCIDEVYDTVNGKRLPLFCCVDPLADITIRIPIEKADAAALAAAMQQVQSLGANPKVIVSDLWAAYPEALRQVWPKARRQLCWFHVMQWVTRKLARLLKEYAASLPEEQRKTLARLRFHLLASPERQARLSDRQKRALAAAWELIRGYRGSDRGPGTHWGWWRKRSSCETTCGRSSTPAPMAGRHDASSIGCVGPGPSASIPGPFSSEHRCPTPPPRSQRRGWAPIGRRSWASSCSTSSA